MKMSKIAAVTLLAGAGLFTVMGVSAANAAGADFDPAQLPDLGTCPAMTLGVGYTSPSPCVASLQESLIASGFTQLGLDGIYGPDTWTAVWNFQNSRGLSVTGNADGQAIDTVNQIANSPQALGDNGAGASGESDEHPEAPEVKVPEDQDDDGPQVVEAPDDELFVP